MHAFVALLDDVGQFGFLFLLAEVLADGRDVDEDLGGGDAIEALLLGGDEHLVHDGQEVVAEVEADGVVLGFLEEVKDAAEGPGGRGGVQGGEDEVAGLGGLDGGVDGFGIAHLADHDDVGVLAEDGAEGLAVVGEVGAQLALVDEGLGVAEDELDGVLDGDDVLVGAACQVADHGGQGGGFAAAGLAADNDDALLLGVFHDLLVDGREVELLEGGDIETDPPQGQGQAAHGAVGLDAVAQGPAGEIDFVGVIDRAVFAEDRHAAVFLAFVEGGFHDGADVFFGEDRVFLAEGAELALDADVGLFAGGQMDVRGDVFFRDG